MDINIASVKFNIDAPDFSMQAIEKQNDFSQIMAIKIEETQKKINLTQKLEGLEGLKEDKGDDGQKDREHTLENEGKQLPLPILKHASKKAVTQLEPDNNQIMAIPTPVINPIVNIDKTTFSVSILSKNSNSIENSELLPVQTPVDLPELDVSLNLSENSERALSAAHEITSGSPVAKLANTQTKVPLDPEVLSCTVLTPTQVELSEFDLNLNGREELERAPSQVPIAVINSQNLPIKSDFALSNNHQDYHQSHLDTSINITTTAENKTKLKQPVQMYTPETVMEINELNNNIQKNITHASDIQQAETKTVQYDPNKTDIFEKELGERLVNMIKGNNHQVTLTLEPPELGKMDINLNVKNDEAQLSFYTSSLQVKAVIESSLGDLRHLFSQEKLSLGEVNVFHQSADEKKNNSSAFYESTAQEAVEHVEQLKYTKHSGNVNIFV